MAKSSPSTIDTPGMSAKSAKKASQPPKSTGKQTTLFGFFSKTTMTPTAQTSSKRVESRASLPLTPLPSSEIGDDASPVRPVVRSKDREPVGGLTTPVSEKNGMEMEVDTAVGSTGSRKKRRVVNYNELSDQESEEEHVPKKRSRNKRKVVDDDDESDVYLPDAQPDKEEEEEEAVSIAPSSPSIASEGSSPEPVVRKRSNLSKFNASTPASSSPSTRYSTPKAPPTLGAFGKPIDKADRAKNFQEKNKDRYSWLHDIRDKEGNRPGDENYDPRTLFIPASAWKTFTAFEKQYWEVKQNLWDTVLFFQKGKFFELYENDATIGHQKFDLKLTDRTNMRMVGVPESHFSYWAAQFVAQGYKVAKASQSENQVSKEMRQKTQSAQQSKKEDIIRRELTCVLTQGTLVDESMLHNELATYCIAVKELCAHEDADPEFGVAYVDASTGEMGICQFKDDRDRTKLETLLAQLKPQEVLLERNGLTKLSSRMLKNMLPSGALWNWLHPDKEFWDEDRTESELLIGNYFSVDREGQGEISSWPEALKKAKDSALLAFSAYGALVFYLRYLKIDMDIVTMGNLQIFDPLKKAGRMILDGKTLTNLEVFENSWDKGVEGTVFRLLWRGVTPFGKRLFRMWLCHPLRSAREINARLDATDTLNSQPEIRDHFLSTFNRLPDLERLLSRIHSGRCKVTDFVRTLEAFQVILKGVNQIKETAEMNENASTGLLGKLLSAFDGLKELLDGWEHAFDWEKAKGEGLLIPMKGVEEDFDESNANLDRILEDLETYRKEYQRKYKSNKIIFKDLGKEIFQIECPVGISVPPNWRLLSSTKAVKRYWSPEVEKTVRQLLEARETHKTVVEEMQGRLYARFDADYEKWMVVVRGVAHLDCLVGLAMFNESGLGEPKCRPEFVEEEEGRRSFVEFEELRHPCVEGVKQDFIPNDVALGGKLPNLVLLTGANMAGKSTLLRQTCIAVIMAQVGCYVPARGAKMTPVDRIMSRLGANDNIFASASTFMVELAETKKIISEATPNSLVILDELGRGTSTYDGVAVAHAVLHHLASHVGCIGFFATHYRNLGEEFKLHPEIGMKTMSVLVDEENREVTFLYKLIDGISEKSYGMNVAAMAGVPHDVVAKAETAARDFEIGSRLAKSLEQSGQGREVSLALQSDFAWLGRLAGDKGEDEDMWDVTRRLKTLLSVVDGLDDA